MIAVVAGKKEADDSVLVAAILSDAAPLLGDPVGTDVSRDIQVKELRHGLIPPQPFTRLSAKHLGPVDR